ncbi:MAG: hypothetical protein HW384_1934 [Dehalococcoidia bacterium]|nr:hypothetical protein [Dehalococcoidia bacterium]
MVSDIVGFVNSKRGNFQGLCIIGDAQIEEAVSPVMLSETKHLGKEEGSAPAGVNEVTPALLCPGIRRTLHRECREAGSKRIPYARPIGAQG